jgi:hypothetical protein
MAYAIRRGADQFLCGSNTTLPRWGTLDAYTALLVFPSVEAADEYMDNSNTITFEDDDVIAILNFT